MGGTVGIAPHLLVDSMAAQNAVQIQLIDHLPFFGAVRVWNGLGQTDNHQRMQR